MRVKPIFSDNLLVEPFRSYHHRFCLSKAGNQQVSIVHLHKFAEIAQNDAERNDLKVRVEVLYLYSRCECLDLYVNFCSGLSNRFEC